MSHLFQLSSTYRVNFFTRCVSSSVKKPCEGGQSDDSCPGWTRLGSVGIRVGFFVVRIDHIQGYIWGQKQVSVDLGVRLSVTRVQDHFIVGTQAQPQTQARTGETAVMRSLELGSV